MNNAGHEIVEQCEQTSASLVDEGHRRRVSPATSTFLDLLRIGAALFVFFHHCAQFWTPRVFAVTAPVAHSAVIVFFVLSGYVISNSTLGKRRGPRQFIVARLSRLYSVVLPSLFLTFCLQMFGGLLNPEFYAQCSRGYDNLRYLLTTCFLQSIWHFFRQSSRKRAVLVAVV